MRLGLRGEVPVELGVELLGEGCRDLDVRTAVAAAGLDEQDARGRVLGEPVGQNASG
jgi:hypothetical protein